LIDRVELLVSELVTNAVQHTRSTLLTLTLIAQNTQLRVCLHDNDPRPPKPRPASTWDLGGRGLHLIQELSDAWGTRPTPSGKWVWFRITSPTPPPRQVAKPPDDLRVSGGSRDAPVPVARR
jgi:anti-sigma regulatory factor (Ser/Thr protein kinase)